MKKIVFLLTASLIAFSCADSKKGAPKNTDLLVDNLSGKVEQTSEITYTTDSTGKTLEQDSCCVVTTRYDEKGYGSSYMSENKAGTDKQQTIYSHDDKGSVTSLKSTKNGKPLSMISIRFDKDGKYSGAQSYDSTNKMDSYYTDIQSNEYGQLTSFKQYNPDSTLKMSMTSTFDKQFFTGNTIKDSSGKETYSSKVKLDERNNLIERTTKTVTKDSTINKTARFRYDSFDDKKNWTQRTEMDEKGQPVKITKRTIIYYKE